MDNLTREVQAALKARGFDPGPIDGIRGKQTDDACFAFAASQFGRQRRTSRSGIVAIASHEGFVPGPYRDSVGVWTAYVGHTASAGAPDPADMPRGTPADLDAALRAGMAVFRADLVRFEDRVRQAFTRPLARHQFDAAVSFDFNTGGIHRAAWVRSFNAGDEAKAATEIMNWSKPASIIPRREAEQRLFRDGVYPDKPMAVWGVSTSGAVQWSKPLRSMDRAEVLAALVAG